MRADSLIMQENLKDILSHLSTEVDQETLLLYLQGKLSAEQQHEVEKKIMENEFASDALGISCTHPITT